MMASSNNFDRLASATGLMACLMACVKVTWSQLSKWQFIVCDIHYAMLMISYNDSILEYICIGNE